MVSPFSKYEYVLTVAEEKSFSRAAEKLFISQPSLSRFIQNLEKELGVELFDRTTVPLKVTYAGEVFVAKARQMMELDRQLVQDISDVAKVNKNRVSIGMSTYVSNYIFPHILPKFYDQYPDAVVTILEKNIQELEKMAYDGDIDFALTSEPLSPNEFNCHNIYTDEIILVTPPDTSSTYPQGAPPKHSISGLPSVSLINFKKKPFIVMQADQILNKITFRLCAEVGFAPHVVLECRSFATAYAMVRMGIGTTLLPYSFIEYIENREGVCCYSISNAKPKYDMMIVYRKGRIPSTPAQTLIGIILDTMRIREYQSGAKDSSKKD